MSSEHSYNNAADDDAVFSLDLGVDNNDGVRATQIHIMQFLVLVSICVDNDGGTTNTNRWWVLEFTMESENLHWNAAKVLKRLSSFGGF